MPSTPILACRCQLFTAYCVIGPKSPSTTSALPAESVIPRLFRSCCNVLTHVPLLPDWICGGQVGGFGVGVGFGAGADVRVGSAVGASVGSGAGVEVASGV